ncbi:MAG: hypothetical protein ACLP7P_05870 [Rhodomicrobium sp.]
MRSLSLGAAYAALCIFAATVTPVRAADAFYMGTWKLSAAVEAPWADPAQKHESGEPAGLLGETVIFREKEIAGPQPFVCKATRYKISDFTAELLFQGAFEEMHFRNASTDPNKIALSLGFSAEKTKTLETGCEIDFHFIDETTAKAGLNDYVYTLKKQ